MDGFKGWIIKVNDTVAAIPFILWGIFCMFGLTQEPGHAILLFIVGFVILSLLAGVWFVLSGIFSQLKRQTELMEQQRKREQNA